MKNKLHFIIDEDTKETITAIKKKVKHGKLKIQRKKVTAEVLKKYRPKDYGRRKILADARKKAHGVVADTKRDISNKMRKNLSTLSENFDFIEESYGSGKLDITMYKTPQECDSISESFTNEDRKYKTIGEARGVFAPIGEMSRNNRKYDDDHYPYILENRNISNKVESRGMLGTIGHHDKKVDDHDLAEGKVSHIVTNLQIVEEEDGSKNLYGILEILDTPAGNLLKTYYESGIPIYVSSRGGGKLLAVANESYKRVDKNNYYLETFDIVKEPGFLQAQPKYLNESEEQKITENNEEENMKLKNGKSGVITEEAVVEEVIAEEVIAEEAVVEEVIAEEAVVEEVIAEEVIAEEAVVEEAIDVNSITTEMTAEAIVQKLLHPLDEKLSSRMDELVKLVESIAEKVFEVSEEVIAEEAVVEEVIAEEVIAEEAVVESKEEKEEDAEEKEEDAEEKEEVSEEAVVEEVIAEEVIAEEVIAEEAVVEEVIAEDFEQKYKDCEIVVEQLLKLVADTAEKVKLSNAECSEAKTKLSIVEEELKTYKVSEELVISEEAQKAEDETKETVEKITEELVETVIAESTQPKKRTAYSKFSNLSESKEKSTRKAHSVFS